ncbi:unnamed protein product [Mytilus edulis]|uniref:CARD domain-containing protein n=1 Tax=Mytilus edulis TaxID=6550 RepID=A0A8S3V4P5_MYTED|nr:unnamed protein product [Mytilus edulis]
MTDTIQLTFEFKEKVKVQSHESLDIGISTTDTSSNTGYTKYVAEKKQKVNRQPIAEDTVQKSGESLLKDFDGLQFSEESMDEFAEVVMLDFAAKNENCNGLSEQDDDKSEQNLPSVIVVGTCSDKLKEPSVQLNEQLGRSRLSVNAVIRRYKMNVVYTLKIKCIAGSYDGRWYGRSSHNYRNPKNIIAILDIKGTQVERDVELLVSDLSTWQVPLFRVRLQKNYTEIVSTIKIENIVDHLIEEDVLTIDDKDVINAFPAQSDKIRKLMEKLMFTEEKGYFKFLSALRLDDCYVDLANQIENTKVTSDDISLLPCCSKLQGQANINNDKFVSEYEGTNL